MKKIFEPEIGFKKFLLHHKLFVFIFFSFSKRWLTIVLMLHPKEFKMKLAHICDEKLILTPNSGTFHEDNY